ncbi:MAG: GNAT family N-acetyltransferase [Ilumatobacteraceae bacterium]
MTIISAQAEYVAGILELAREVEDWFGPMVDDPGFHGAVHRKIAQGRALVADESGRVVGGLLFADHRAPTYELNWIVVASSRRASGVGQELLAEAVRRWVAMPAVLGVVTFGADHPGARSRRFYERLGFAAVGAAEAGPEGGSRERFELVLDALPAWAG